MKLGDFNLHEYIYLDRIASNHGAAKNVSAACFPTE